MPVLPIGESTLVYGSNDAGRTVKCSDETANNAIKEASRYLFFASHIVGDVEIFTAGDLEIHSTSIGFFLLDLSRCFPPEDFVVIWDNEIRNRDISYESIPPEIGSTSLWYKMLRPEFLQWLKSTRKTEPLSPDSLSSWGKIGAQVLNERVCVATKLLLSERLHYIVDFLFYVPLNSTSSLPFNLICHKFGMNVRHLGSVFTVFQNRADSFPSYRRSILLQLFSMEFFSRTMKSLLREACRIRNTPGIQEKESKIAKLLQHLQELPQSNQNNPFRILFVQCVHSKFGYSTAMSVNNLMEDPSLVFVWKEAILRAIESVGLLLSQKAIDNFRSSQNSYVFTVADFADFTVRIKSLCIFERCKAIAEIKRADLACDREQMVVESSFRSNSIQFALQSMTHFGSSLSDFQLLISQGLMFLKSLEKSTDVISFALYLLTFCFLEFKTQSEERQTLVLENCRMVFDGLIGHSKCLFKANTEDNEHLHREFMTILRFFDSFGVFHNRVRRKLVLCRLRSFGFVFDSDISQEILLEVNEDDPSVEDLLILATWTNQGWNSSSSNSFSSSISVSNQFANLGILSKRLKQQSVWGWYDEVIDSKSEILESKVESQKSQDDVSNLSTLDGFLLRGNYEFYEHFFQLFDTVVVHSSNLLQSEDLECLMKYWHASSNAELLLLVNLPAEYTRLLQCSSCEALEPEKIASFEVLSSFIDHLKKKIPELGPLSFNNRISTCKKFP
jgi:hypothetical protein